MINYYCPGFAESQPTYKTLFWLRDNYPECFYPNVRIAKIFGNFPNMIWNGGSSWHGKTLEMSDVREYFEWYSKKNVVLQLVCTNPILEETDVYDRYCNAILKVASDYDFIEVLVSSPILEKYIRENYPKIKIDKSIIATTGFGSDEDNLDNYLKLAEQYNKCVLPRKYTQNLEFLKQIPEEKRSKFELLVTDPCPINCPRLSEHYKDLAKGQLFLDECCENNRACSMPFSDSPFRHWTYRKYRYTYDEIVENLEPLGFSEIKLSGRLDMITTILSIVPYLIKPEYQKDVYTGLLRYFTIGDLIRPSFD